MAAADHDDAQGKWFRIRPLADQSFLMILGCKLRFRLGRVVIWRHRAMHRVAPDRDAQRPRSHVPRIAAIGALDEQRHHEHRERRDGIPVECISAECQPQRGVDDDDKKGGGMSRLCVPKTLFELMT